MTAPDFDELRKIVNAAFRDDETGTTRSEEDSQRAIEAFFTLGQFAVKSQAQKLADITQSFASD